MELTAIQTTYRGCLFRSRLEARWAIFFDALKIKWHYEPQGYSLPPIHGEGEPIFYLPDFKIPKQPLFPKPLWVEIKGENNTFADEKMSRLVTASETRGTILNDIPYPTDIEPDRHFHPGWYNSSDLCEMELSCWFPGDEADNRYCFCQCPFCLAFGFEFDGRSARIGCNCSGHATVANGDKTYNNASPDLLAAYKMARSARFEHGEGG